jgi:hypothetical protein
MKNESKELTADLPPGSGKGWAMCGRISAGIRAEQFFYFVPSGHRAAFALARMLQWPSGGFILCMACT